VEVTFAKRAKEAAITTRWTREGAEAATTTTIVVAELAFANAIAMKE